MVILIPYNPIPTQDRHLRAQVPIASEQVGGRYDGSSRETIERFKTVLARARIPATVRLTRGRDIEAACGQLAAGRRTFARLSSGAGPSGCEPLVHGGVSDGSEETFEEEHAADRQEHDSDR